MMRSILALVVALLALGSSEAFSPLPNSIVSERTQSSTAIYFFGGNKSQNNDKKKGKGKAEEKKKKTPMIMMFGKPQYDWVKNREIKPGENTKRMNWLYKPDGKK